MLNIGTFASDLILVRVKDVVPAFNCIKNVLTIINKHSGEVDLKKSVEEMSPMIKSSLTIKTLLKSFPNIKISQVPTHALIASIEREHLRKNMYALMKLIFFTKPPFFCYVETTDEISVVLDESSAAEFEHGQLISDMKLWIALKLDIPEGFDFDVCGVVNAMCSPLAKVRLEFLNVSTYSTDYTLVHSDDLDEALDLLHTT
eukprot:TRINITY_DN45942_c1_g1_i3.p1 TRINITY_DN45942_c1_g1~~TRINITY_DN45942_c1_g1_i3.p1  ORF type:complete len:202 (-),score=64.11 TRINITY_DN45942_c1_g1_i3:53-658(-)